MGKKKTGYRLGAYDYFAAHMIVVNGLQCKGENPHMTSTEMSMVTIETEACANAGFNLEQATPRLMEVVSEIVRSRHANLFPVYDERDNMGDETVSVTQADGIAA